MGAASLAVVYVAFAAVFVYLNLSSLSMPSIAAMNKAVSERLNNLPFSETGSMSKSVEDIQDTSDVVAWLNNVVANVIYEDQQQSTATSGANSTGANADNMATVSSFNRILLMRMTAKRRIMSDNNFGKFKATARVNAFPKVLQGNSRLSVDSVNKNEDRATVCHSSGAPCLEWKEAGSYEDSGGYYVFIDPTEGPQAFRDRVQEWVDMGMFDLRLGTFAFDLMAYNTNTDLFLHRGWLFTFDFAGNCYMRNAIRAFSLKGGEKSEDAAVQQWILTLVLWIFVVIFILREVVKLYNLGFYQHFRHKAAWVDIVSLLMCAVVLLTYRILESQSIFETFTFTRLFDPSTMAEVYGELTSLGVMVEEQQYIIAFNLLLVFTRAVVLVAELQANFRLILEVLDQCSSTLAYFLVMFVLIMMGFVFMGFFVFGSGCREFSRPMLAFYTTFSMLTGQPVFDRLLEADEPMAFLFFYLFYILFYLVFINVFVSILMAGYDAVVAKMKDTEDSPFTKIVDEIKHEFVDRIIAFGKFVGGFIYRCPLVDACASCFWGCVPTCSMPSCGKWFGRGSSQDDDAPSQKTAKGARASSADRAKEKSTTLEVLCVMAFMANTLSFLTLQVRGESCFNLAQSVVHEPLEQSQWAVQAPPHVEDFKEVQSFKQVREWTKHVVGNILYATPQCATLLSDGTAVYTNPDTQQGCNNTKDSEQLVQIINDWNVGFMNTTFVRLTIKPACFIATPEPRWREAMPWQRQTPDIKCASEDCISTLKEYQCQSPDGTSLSMSDITRFPVAGSSSEFYNWSSPETALGSYMLKGGFVFSLGTSKSEADTMLQMLEDDNWFSQKTASMVFDFITYNGNLDMFTYTEVGFSLLATGRMSNQVSSVTFPMNINEGGGFYSTDRIWTLVLFSVYVFMVLCQCLEIVRRVIIIKRGKTIKKAFFDFFGDVWNISDSISLGMAILTVVYFMMFALMPFRKDYKFSVDGKLRYQVPNDDEKIYNMPKSVSPQRFLQEDWYIFHQFERIKSTYAMFLTVSAINCFLFSIKVVKYVGQMKGVQVFSDTLDSGKTRNSYFAIVILLQMSGFALFFHIIFGEAVENLSTWESSIVTLFLWMVGEYDLVPLMKQDEVVAVVWFSAFMVSFYFISTNMFLATMLSVYCDTVGAEDQEKASQKYRARKDVVVHYHDKATMLDEIKPENLELKEGEVMVREFKADTQPSNMGVQKGHILAKVNGEPKLWKDHCKSVAEIFERGLPDEGEIHLEFVERLFKQDRSFKRVFSFFKRVVDDEDSEVHVKPTCKNFWRMEGAIGCIAREAANLENEDGEEDGEGGGGGEGAMEEDDGEGGEDSGSEDEGHAGRKSSDAVRKARRRIRAKKKLDSLLFSRWSDGKRQHGVDGAVGTGHGWEAFGGSDELGGQPKEIQYEVDHLEVFQLRDEMHKLPISGQEAWLDCLVSAVEREMDDDSVIADVLRTSEMQDAVKNKHGREQKPVQEFFRHADEVVKMLEFKANKKYYQYLQIESEQRQELLRSQNEVLHDYVCELETEFTKVMELIHKNRAKKEVMLTKLAGLLDRTMYRHLDKTAPAQARPAISRGAHDEEDERRLSDANVPAIRNV